MKWDPRCLGAALLPVLLAASVNAADTREWRLASGFGEGVFHTRNLHAFAADVNATVGDAMALRVHTGGSKLALGAIKAGVIAGDVEVGEFILADSAADNALFEVDAVPFLAPNYAKAEVLWKVSRDAIERHLAEEGLAVLFAVPWPPQGLFSKQPLERIGDLEGRGMRIYNASTQAIAKLTGAKPMRVATRDLGKAMAGDELQLMLLPASTGARIDAPYYFPIYYDAMAWLPKNIVVVNADALAALDEETRVALLAAGERAERSGWQMSRREYIERTAALRLRGAEVQPLPVELKRAFYEMGRKMTFEWSNRAGPAAAEIVERFYASQ